MDAAFMRAHELAAAADASLAPVSRFPRALGYPDFDASRGATPEQAGIELSSLERVTSLAYGNKSSTATLHCLIEKGIEALCMWGRGLSPLLPLDQHSFVAKESFRNFVRSLAAPVALIDRIGPGLGRRMGDTALQRLMAAGQAAAANGTYVGTEQSLKHLHGWRDSLLRQAGARQKARLDDRGLR